MTNLVLIASSFSRCITHGVRDIDNTWTAFAVIFTLIAINEPAQASASFEFTLKALIGIAPFLLGAIAIAA